MAVGRRTELTRGSHCVARESEREGEWSTTLTRRARNAERERERERERSSADRLAPPGRGKWGARVRGRGLWLTGGTHVSGEAGARVGRLAGLG